jgi:type II secretory pathway pseudopilin PulG
MSRTYFLRPVAVAAALALSAMLAMPTQARDDEAKEALARAEAKMEMVTRSGNPPATQSNAFMNAQRKIEAAHMAMRDNDNREAELLATEAEVWAEATAVLTELTALDRQRAELDRSVNILATEIGRN